MDTNGFKVGDKVKAKGQKSTYRIEDFFDKGTHVSAFIVPELGISTWWPVMELTLISDGQQGELL